MKAIVTTVSVLCMCAVAFALVAANTARWGGSCGFTQLEYELTFKDSHGKPVEGVELKIEDGAGNEFFCFPVTDSLPGRPLRSDEHGVIRFHHVSSAVEWDNYGWSVFGMMFETTSSPAYVCRFLRDGTEVHRVSYWSLPSWDWDGKGWEEVPKVKRRWNWPLMVPKDLLRRPTESEEDYDARLGIFFHVDRNEKVKREGPIALRNACRLANKAEEAHHISKAAFEDLEFPVISRTIVVGPR